MRKYIATAVSIVALFAVASTYIIEVGNGALATSALSSLS